MNAWEARDRTLRDVLTPWPVRGLQSLLGQEPVAEAGDALPLGWHWLFFREITRPGALGDDGHPRRGGFLPPVSRPRRMWAGGHLVAHSPLVLGEAAVLHSRVERVEEKTGRSGALTVVTVRHEVHQGGRAVEEEQVLIYRDSEREQGRTAAGSSPSPSEAAAGGTRWSETYTPTRVALFQFSALTWNAHRIHYDHTWATGREGYQDILVHAPLTALLLLDRASRHDGAPRSFRYRALSPLYVERPITLAGLEPDGPEEEVVEARTADGTVAMRGWAGR